MFANLPTDAHLKTDGDECKLCPCEAQLFKITNVKLKVTF